MKVLHRIIRTVLLLTVCGNAMAQSADDRAGAAMNASDWFGLRRIYITENQQLSPFLRDMAKALLDDAFNRPVEAAVSIRKLLKDHRNELGTANIRSMTYLLATNESRAGNNKKAANTLHRFLQQARGQLDSTHLQMFASRERLFRTMARYTIDQLQSNGQEYEIPFRIDSIGPEKKRSIQITIPAQVNGTACDVNFDTGAGVNVISPELARKCGMRMLDVRSWVAGVNAVAGNVALADRVKLGNVVMHNVLFHVIQIKSGNAVADQYMRHLDCVIGVPLLRALGIVQIDFANNRLRIPQIGSATEGTNLCLGSPNGMMQLEMMHNGDTLVMNPDTGAGHQATLYYRYFKRNATDIAARGARAVNSSAGVGGISVIKGYRLKDFSLAIGDVGYCIPDVFVSMEPESDHNIQASSDGNVGLEYFQKFRIVTFDLHRMAVTLTPYLSAPNSEIARKRTHR